MSSVLEDREETVKLFIKSLMSGQISISRIGFIGQKDDRHERYLHVLNKKITEFQVKPDSDNIDFIYGAVSRLRLFGFLEGKLVDYDKKFRELDKKIADLGSEIENVHLENKRLKEENIKLSEELKDRQHAMKMYEGKFIKDDSNDSKV